MKWPAVQELGFEVRDGALVVRVDLARLDAVAAPAFRDALLPAAAGRRKVVLDLDRVRFLDSSGVAALVSTLKKLEPGGQVRLVGAHDEVRQVLKLTRLEKVFPVDPSVEDALRA